MNLRSLFFETLMDGYVWVSQNVSERYLVSINIKINFIKPSTKPSTIYFQ